MAAYKKKKPPFAQPFTIPLADNHGWRCSEGHKLMIISRGDMRFEYPNTWVSEFGEAGSVKLRDRVHPYDDMVLEISIIRTPQINWDKLPPLVSIVTSNMHQLGHFVTPDEVRSFSAPGVEIAWADHRKIEEDPKTGQPREALWRQAQAHPGRFHTGKYTPFGVITYGYWVEFNEVADAAWQHVVESMVMGEKITDPSVGPRWN